MSTAFKYFDELIPAAEAERRELWRYANIARLERLELPPGHGVWHSVPPHQDYEWVVDGGVGTLRVAAGTTVSLTLLHELQAGASFGQLNVEIGAGAAVRLRVALDIGAGALVGIRSHVNLAEGATLNYLRLPALSDDSYLFTHTTVNAAADATYNYFCLSDCGAQTRHQLDVTLAGKQAHATLAGIYRLTGRQVAEHTLRVTHAAPDTTSQQFFRGTADGQSRGVFQGKITVAHGADRTDAQQSHKALLLGPRAEIDTKPELEIYADEVKCSHGASIGALDQAALFYLRSRGIGTVEAQGLLTQAFVAEALHYAPAFAEQLQDRLAHADS